MNNWVRGFAAFMLFSTLALGQATPISSTAEQPQSAAAAPQQKSTHVHKAKAHHAKAHHGRHKRQHKTA